jgi:hypothetical protein
MECQRHGVVIDQQRPKTHLLRAWSGDVCGKPPLEDGLHQCSAECDTQHLSVIARVRAEGL